MNNEEKQYKFKGVAEKCIYNSTDFKVYAFTVNKNDYPEIKYNKYNNVSVSGELHDLTLGIEYEIVAAEQQSKYGTNYKVIHIKRDVPKTSKDMQLFLQEILTKNQAEVLYRTYPDIVERVKENRLDDIDFSKLKGIKEYTFEKIKNKIIENFALSDLVVEFKGYLSLPVIKKIYDKYSSVEKLKEKLKSDPYKCLCGISGIGFKIADDILLNIEKVSKENIKNNKEPIIDFESDLRTSSQRCLSCILYLLNENENEGNTKTNMVELRKECIKLTPECIDSFTEAVKDESIYYNKDTMDIALRSTYNTEKYIADSIVYALNNYKDNIWDYDENKYRNVGEYILSDEQIKAVYNVCKYPVSILNGAAGTGKSASAQAVINMLKEHKKTFRLFSPTGK